MTASGRRARHRIRPAAGVVGFVLKFMIFWTVALVLVSQVPNVERWAVDVTVANLIRVLRLFSVQSLVSGNRVLAGATSIEIVPDCTPLMPTLVLWAAMCAFPVAWRRRMLGLLLGAAVVWVFNLLRVLALLAVLQWRPQDFKVAHVYLWQTGTLLAVTAMFVLWVRFQTRPAVAR
jgi:exosortase/archaeosortase family protein